MNRDEQVQAAKTALDLEKRINDLEKSLRTNRGLKFTEPEPQPPVRQKSTYVEPPVEDGCKVNWLLMFGPWGAGIIANLIFLGASIVFYLSCICVIWAPVYYFLVYKKQKKEAIDRILNSAEYKAQCVAAKKAMQDKQCEYDDIYEKAKENTSRLSFPNIRQGIRSGKKSDVNRSNMMKSAWCKLRGNYRLTMPILASFRRSIETLPLCNTFTIWYRLRITQFSRLLSLSIKASSVSWK